MLGGTDTAEAVLPRGFSHFYAKRWKYLTLFIPFSDGTKLLQAKKKDQESGIAHFQTRLLCGTDVAKHGPNAVISEKIQATIDLRTCDRFK